MNENDTYELRFEFEKNGSLIIAAFNGRGETGSVGPVLRRELELFALMCSLPRSGGEEE